MDYIVRMKFLAFSNDIICTATLAHGDHAALVFTSLVLVNLDVNVLLNIPRASYNQCSTDKVNMGAWILQQN